MGSCADVGRGGGGGRGSACLSHLQGGGTCGKKRGALLVAVRNPMCSFKERGGVALSRSNEYR